MLRFTPEKRPNAQDVVTEVAEITGAYKSSLSAKSHNQQICKPEETKRRDRKYKKVEIYFTIIFILNSKNTIT